jgi:hypothetical protein
MRLSTMLPVMAALLACVVSLFQSRRTLHVMKRRGIYCATGIVSPAPRFGHVSGI